MIARIWRGTTAADRAQEYLVYLRKTGLADYASTPGNRGVQVLLRTRDDRTLFTVISLWDSLEAIKGFAGPARFPGNHQRASRANGVSSSRWACVVSTPRNCSCKARNRPSGRSTRLTS